ncbi:MAG: DUF3592 domain-containing protein [Clostridia bacterium]|nr:DUF3592 domain-containing protein [Clostridia bacterium]
MKAKIISAVLIVICMVCGIFMLCIGVHGSHDLSKKTKQYETVTGYLLDYSIYSNSRRGRNTTYRLTYSYIVNDEEYIVSTDYGIGYVPQKGSEKTIMYNPDNPKEAIILGTNRYSLLILFGFMFIAVPLLFILGYIYTLGYFAHFRMNPLDIVIGIVFFAMGIGIIYIQANEISIVELFTVFRIWIIIPILFIVVGIYLMIRGMFFPEKLY